MNRQENQPLSLILDVTILARESLLVYGVCLDPRAIGDGRETGDVFHTRWGDILVFRLDHLMLDWALDLEPFPP